MARDQVERYRQAAEDALGQLDWCIRYLRRIHKERISGGAGQEPRPHQASVAARGARAAAIADDARIVIGPTRAAEQIVRHQ